MTTPTTQAADAVIEAFEAKCARNARVQARYDQLMQEGKHGHYETMFRVVREEVEASASRESALIEERDALRVVAIEQSALLGELSKGLFPDDDLFAQIVEVGAKLDALAAPAVEGA